MFPRGYQGAQTLIFFSEQAHPWSPLKLQPQSPWATQRSEPYSEVNHRAGGGTGSREGHQLPCTLAMAMGMPQAGPHLHLQWESFCLPELASFTGATRGRGMKPRAHSQAPEPVGMRHRPFQGGRVLEAPGHSGGPGLGGDSPVRLLPSHSPPRKQLRSSQPLTQIPCPPQDPRATHSSPRLSIHPQALIEHFYVQNTDPNTKDTEATVPGEMLGIISPRRK